ncbi:MULTISPECIES: glutathione S-transferase family protein [Rhizobium]|uniref:glutathione S-transferase family protein n=1 Tax=Rhizobium TaxID=379 RepID=UPI001B3226CB|nr:MULTISPECIES: glutathione S-transferase family protein [Rhizobium]MBX4907365.1 glutathione S-transferase family protein [Rhizobium bangladeshense]MBX5215126.1 glutathione S-transferase family protein [Rhizobium sp. NLR9a]MBX5220945.1 glutathione S-transferase family protein [Rhizobium sp. NLR8a]MBX5227122.1 glutathione S-transferase family protein [Rhizobium sp. NLR9b]MBX5232292.1 glutathione S-transferase family protein [Rhizobium sp. NLR4a]
MDRPTLYIANKNYSSWSFRPWMALTSAGVDFEEILIPFDDAGGNPNIKAISPSGRVPVLQHGGLKIWESLAIIEYAAELYPDAGLWPRDRAERALARSVSMEMLSGFRALRNACPMNIRRPRGGITLPDGVDADVSRIETIWRNLLQKSGGPFLFGAFSGVDAMFAPVVNRFDIYDLVSREETLAYMETMKAHPAWRKWEEAARAEPWIVPEDEV